MSKVQVSIVRLFSPGVAAPPLPSAKLLVAPPAIITSSTTAQTLSIALEDVAGYITSQTGSYAYRVAVGGSDDVVVAFSAGDSAVDDGTNGYLCPAGGVYEFVVEDPTYTVSVINAA
jgi:hypothetical protein